MDLKIYVPTGDKLPNHSPPLLRQQDHNTNENVVISVIDNSSSLVNSPRVLRIKRYTDIISKWIKELLSPALSVNNVRIFGSKKLLQIERERSYLSNFVIHPLSKVGYFQLATYDIFSCHHSSANDVTDGW